MFDIGWSEMAIIMLLALIIIGPKDLPRVARTIGQWVRKGRMLAREFQTSLEDMARDTELEDVKKEIEKVGRTDFKKSIENTIDPKGELAKAFDVSKDAEADAASETKPAVTDKAAGSAKENPGKTPVVNGHADDVKAASGDSTSVAATKAAPAAAKSTAATKKPAPRKRATTAKAGAGTAKTGAKPRRTAASSKKTAAGKNGSTATAAAKKPAASAKTAGVKKNPAKKTAVGDRPSQDEGGADQTAVAAKPS